MASGSPSRGEMEESFSIVAGDFTEAEKEYMRRKGLIYENSNDETLDVSTDIGSLNSSSVSRSHMDSLLMFEVNEQLYANLIGSASKQTGSPSNSPKSPEVQRLRASKRRNSALFSPGYSHSLTEENDKENEFKGPMGIQRRLTFQDELDRVREPLEEIKGLSEQSGLLDVSFDKSPVATPGKMSPHPSEDEVCLVPCTQDVDDSGTLDCVSDEVDVVPCTQILDESRSPTDVQEDNVVSCALTEQGSVHNLNETYTSDILEESLAEELVPCTQEASMISEDGDVSSVPCSQGIFDVSSVPCSQSSQSDTSSIGNSQESTKDELNDTIAVMERLLKLADEQEEKEKMEAEQAAEAAASISNEIDQEQPQTKADPSEPVVTFKTPLKHDRVRLLKNKKVASPSPPRSFANTLLKQRGEGKEKPSVNVKAAAATPTSSAPMRTSTPNRAPVTPGASIKKNHTPGRSGVSKTPVQSRVDSGLKAGFPIGLSPVAKYIYDKPAPSKFARVHPTIANSSANNSFSRIPVPPSSRVNQLPSSQKSTPASASKLPRQGALKTSTYFNLTATPPRIVGNEKSVSEKKQFKPMQYTGPSKVKTVSGKVASPRENDFVAHRHTGFRDESGNASIIQNTMVQKRTIPQSRLTTPKNEGKTGDHKECNAIQLEKNSRRRLYREQTYVIS